jgi:hypothetical protein
MSVIAGIFAFYSAIPDWLKKLIATLLIGLTIFTAGDIRGKRVARAQCEEQAKRAQRAADAQDLQAEKEGRAADLEITNALTQQKKVDDDKIAALQKQLAGSKCVYDKSTADPDPDAEPRRVRKLPWSSRP